MSISITTNNNFVDNIVEYLKILSLESVLKNEDMANNEETLQSVKESDLYISCIENSANIDSFSNIPLDVLVKSLIPQNIIQDCLNNKDNIPKQYVDVVVSNMKKYITSTYIEYNNYYRNLNGLPDINDEGLYIDLDIDLIDRGKKLHEMSNEEIKILESHGIIDSLKSQYPEKRYLNHLGQKKIPYYLSRKAYRFGLIYCPEIESSKISNRFKELIEKNRVYTLKTIYSDAFKYGSDYYDNFIELFIKIQTIVDIINEIPEIVIKKDFFDSDSIRDMFLSHGIDYFPEIPLRYQLAMVKNLNTLLKFKSTTKNIIDICSIFGFDNIEIFKYYLLKDRKVDANGEYTDPIYKEVDGKMVEKDDANYELKFIKVPVNDIADNYVRNPLNHLGYDEIVNSDPYWNADQVHDEVKSEILNRDFNYILSKYLSIDTVYDMSNLSFEMAYFFNMVFDNKELEESLEIPINSISYNRKFKLTDVLCLLYVLTYENIGIEDTILDTTSKILHVTSFNFKADLSKLSSYIHSKGYTEKELGIDGFTIPRNDILSYNELMNIYIKNKEIYNHIIKQLHDADNIHIYRIYKKIYDALMISELNTTIFKDRSGNFAGTYTNYLKDRDILLYETILNLRSMDDIDKQSKLSEIMDDVLVSLETYINIKDLNLSFSNVSNISTELVKSYIYKIINFFKSHTVQLLSMNVVYVLDNKMSNKVIIIDDIIRSGTYEHKTASRHNIAVDSISIFNKEIIKKHTLDIDDNIFIFRTYN